MPFHDVFGEFCHVRLPRTLHQLNCLIDRKLK